MLGTTSRREATGTSPKRVLIVDDEPSVRQVICSALVPNYACSEAASAEEALGLLGGAEFDLLICDVALGGMSGIELVKRARRKNPDLRVVIMSGAQEKETVVAALRARVNDYLSKPFDLYELWSCVVGACGDDGDGGVLEDKWLAAANALMTALGAKDFETNGHAERVVSFGLRLGREVGLSRADMIALELGARLHDVGKIGVPDSILRKPAPLTEEEWSQMKEHPTRGEAMVRKLKLPDGAARVVGQHHEMWDGSGYPNGLAGEQIALPARVFSVVDAFDAITSDRVYRPGASYEEALRRITRAAGTQFDPEVVAAFGRVAPSEWQRIRSECESEGESHTAA